MKFLLTFAILAAFSDVTFVTNIHCRNCVHKVEDNLSFEKGVKDLKVNLDDKTVYIKYDGKKTDVEKLSRAINKLGYTAVVKEDADTDGKK